MHLIDTHSHIYSSDFSDDRAVAIRRAVDAGVQTILMPAIDNSTHPMMLRTEEEDLLVCRSMMGLHPCSVKADFQHELDIISTFLRTGNFIAVGETGLDFYWDLTFKDQQYAAFRQQIDWSMKYKLPIVIHSRNSTDECIAEIAAKQDGSLTGVFHCFSGTVEQARQIMDLGFYIGIGGVLTFKNSGMDAVLRSLSLERVVLETDAPYLAPVPYRGKRNEPAYLTYVAQKLADVKEIPVEEVARVTTENAKALFKL